MSTSENRNAAAADDAVCRICSDHSAASMCAACAEKYVAAAAMPEKEFLGRVKGFMDSRPGRMSEYAMQTYRAVLVRLDWDHHPHNPFRLVDGPEKEQA